MAWWRGGRETASTHERLSAAGRRRRWRRRAGAPLEWPADGDPAAPGCRLERRSGPGSPPPGRAAPGPARWALRAAPSIPWAADASPWACEVSTEGRGGVQERSPTRPRQAERCWAAGLVQMIQQDERGWKAALGDRQSQTAWRRRSRRRRSTAPHRAAPPRASRRAFMQPSLMLAASTVSWPVQHGPTVSSLLLPGRLFHGRGLGSG